TSSICTIRGSPTKQKKFGSPTKLRQWFLCSGNDDSSSNLASRCTTWVLMDERNCQEMILMSLENKLDNMEIILMCKLR
ncbi:unnamed protein product, partial [Brassica oleracea]